MYWRGRRFDLLSLIADMVHLKQYTFRERHVHEMAKMAEVSASVCDLATLNYKVRSVNQPTECSSCLKYKREWEEKADELITAKKIIQLPQEDLNTYKDLTTPHVPDVRRTSHINS